MTKVKFFCISTIENFYLWFIIKLEGRSVIHWQVNYHKQIIDYKLVSLHKLTGLYTWLMYKPVFITTLRK